MPLRNLSLRRKLTLVIMLTSSVALLLAFAGSASYDVLSFRKIMVRNISILATVLGENSKAPLIFGDVKSATEVLQAVEAEPHIITATIFRRDGARFAHYLRPGAVEEGTLLPAADGAYFQPGRLVEFHHITLGDETLGAIYIESDLTELDQHLRAYIRIVALVLLASSLVAYLLAAWLQRPISQPILDLLHTTEEISVQNNYALRATVSGRDEVSLLVEGFNGMLDQIQRRDQELERQQANLQAEVEARTAINLQLEAAKEMAEGASRAKGDFLANMSHEIRTPINGVLGMIELTLETELTAEQKDNLQMARSSGESLLTIINDILDFSKVESGKLELDHIEFNLYNSVGETMRALALRAHQKGLELTYDVAPDVPSRVMGDPGRLRQVLVNLVGNAIKFTKQGEVSLEIWNESKEKNQVRLHFKVSDTGIGIPQKKHGILFQAFSQADTSTTRKYGGSGLGLAICARLVELMGGTIWVESDEGAGSRFHFTAQFVENTSAEERTSPAAEHALRGVRVLVVDDNANNRKILTSMTALWGMLPTAADSAASALSTLQTAKRQGAPFRVVLLDGHMPEADGFQTAALIGGDPEDLKAIILMLTSSGLAGEAARRQELGIAAYLLKPVLRSDLRNALLTVLGSQPAEPGTSKLVTRHTLREAPQKLRILVAEDNEVNQTLVVRLLQKMGHESVLAKDGQEALLLSTTHSFDLILMDVQMPVMDGLAATKAIREMEKSTSKHMPIFAITARAMKGDDELCLRAGMDGYISKPIRFSDVENALASVRKGLPSPAPVRHAEWSQSEALDRVGGDEQLLHELCEIFLRESPRLLEKLKQAIAQDDAATVRRVAHSLKGEVSYLSAENVSHTAQKLEQMGVENNLSGAPALLASLEIALRDLHAVMHRQATEQQAGVRS
jgi:two-component system, sensor histidine kinase and response regulator